MQETHQKLIESFKKNETSINKSQIKPMILELIMVAIVIYMKSIQKSASLKINLIGTSCSLLILAMHFWNFYPRRYLLKEKASIVLKGLETEKQNQFSGLSFFQNYLREFNILGQILTMAIFDIILIYFFSVSYTQLIKTINPDMAIKLTKSLRPVSTFLINVSLGYAYYKPFKPIIQAKKELEGGI